MMKVAVVDNRLRTIEEMDTDGTDLEFLAGMETDPEIGSLCCLRFVDPRGNTIFNRRQMGTLARELEWLDRRASTASEKKAVKELRRLARRVGEGIHMYLLFRGE